MDIGSIVAKESELELQHPDEKTGGLGIFINLHSMEHPFVKRITRNAKDEMNKLRSRGKSMPAAKEEEFRLQILVAATAGWRWDKDVNGDPATLDGVVPDFSPLAVLKLYQSKDWAANQVDEALGDVGSFFKS